MNKERMKDKMFQLFDSFIENPAHPISVVSIDIQNLKNEINIQNNFHSYMSIRYTLDDYSNIPKIDYNLYDYDFMKAEEVEKTYKSIKLTFSSDPPLYLKSMDNFITKSNIVIVERKVFWFLRKKVRIEIINNTPVETKYSLSFGDINIPITREEFEKRYDRVYFLNDTRKEAHLERNLDDKLEEYTKPVFP